MNLKELENKINKVYSDRPIVAQLCMAQALLESNLLNKPSQLAIKYNNLFGIKDVDGKSKVDLMTTECNAKTCWKESEPFEVYASIEDCIRWHRLLMQRPRYTKVWNAKTFEEACKEVQLAGYATDRLYTDKLINIYKKYR